MTLNGQLPRRTPSTQPTARLLSSAILTFTVAWPIMVLVGVLHSDVHQVPALGYWATIVALVILDLASLVVGRDH